MEYLTLKNAEFVEVMRQLNEITTSGNLVRKVFDFINVHKQILTSEEYFYENTTMPRMPPGVIGMMVMKSKYSINMKISTILILALLIDSQLVLPIASNFLGFIGYSTKVIEKIQDNERCIIIDILLGGKKTYQEFNYYKNECILNDINCPYRKEYVCDRKIDVIKDIIKKLEEKIIIKHVNGKYVQCF